MYKFFLLLIVIITITAGCFFLLRSKENKGFVVYYSNKLPAESFKDFDIVILDSIYNEDIKKLAKTKSLFGYISLGEVNENKPFFNKAKENNLLLKENQNWRGSYFIDVKNLEWKNKIINEIIPSLMKEGFNGIFFDNLDSPVYLENLDKEKYKGMKNAAVEIIKTVRKEFPSLKIIVNRGLDIAEEISPYVDMIMLESTYTSYDFKEKKYFINEAKIYNSYIEKAKSIKNNFPHIEFLALDYWPSEDKKFIKKLYSIHRKQDFKTYISEIDLQNIYFEPKHKKND